MSGVPAAVYKLLTQASSLPCSSGAGAFLSLVPVQNDWVLLALDALLPILKDQNIQIPQRILAAYLLYDIYHDQLNPFHEHLFRVFESERAAALMNTKYFESTRSPVTQLGSSREGGGSGSGLHVENEQLVWVLWKILKGEGNDLGPYSPNILSRAALPEHLRASHLTIQDTQQHNHNLATDTDYSLNTEVPRLANATSFEHEPSLTVPITSITRNRPTSFSPFDNDTFTDLHHHQYEDTRHSADGWFHEQPSDAVRQEQYQRTSDFPRQSPARSYSAHSNTQFDVLQASSSPSPTSIRSTTIDDTRRQALLRALCTESPQDEAEDPAYLRGVLGRNTGEVENGSKAHQVNLNRQIGHASNQVIQGIQMSLSQPQNSPVFSAHTHAQLNLQSQGSTSQHNRPGLPRPVRDSTPFIASSPAFMNATRPKLGLIAPPQLTPSSYYSSTAPHDPESRSVSAELSTTGLSSQLDRLQIPDGFSQQSWRGSSQQSHVAAENGFPQQTSTANGFLQQAQPSGQHEFSQSPRTPGVIGSGRPSSKPISPVETNTPSSLSSSADKTRPHVGVIGNGRPAKDSPQAPKNLGKTSRFNGERESGMLLSPSVPRMEKSWEETEWRAIGVIGRPKPNTIGRKGLDSDGARENLSNGGQSTQPLVQAAALPHVDEMVSQLSQADPGDSVSHLTSALAQLTASRPPTFNHATQVAPRTHPLSPEIPSNTTSPARSLDNDSRSDRQEHTPSEPRLQTSASPSGSTSHNQPIQPLQSSHLPPIRSAGQKDVLHSEVNEEERDELSRAIVLLLSARERVLTLPEQRMLIPHLILLTRPLSLLRPGDLHPLIAKNPDVAAKLLVLLLDRDDEDGARVERVLRDVSKNDLFHVEHALGSRNMQSSPASSFDSLDAVNAIQSAVEFIGSYGDQPESSRIGKAFPFGGREAREGYLDSLRRLPPTMQSFNLIARLLRPTQFNAASTPAAAGSPEEQPEMRVATLVREEVLGGLVSGCVQWIEKAEKEEKEGDVSDDRVAVSVSSLSRFYSSLLKHGFVSASSEVDTTEIMSFALQFSRFEEARSLYSTLVAARA